MNWARNPWTGGLLVLAGLLLHRPAGIVAGALLLALAGLAAAWQRWGLARVRYRRILGQTGVFPGEPADLWVEVENDKPLPLPWLVIQDQVPAGARVSPVPTARISADRAEMVQTVQLGWFQRLRRHFLVSFPHRGLQVLGPAYLTAGDPFGLATQQAAEEERTEVVVYPRLVPLSAVGISARQLAQQLVARRGLLEDPLQVIGLRNYQPGDELSRIHWKASARSGQLQSKVYAPPADPAVVIFCDLTTHSDWWFGVDRERVETVISVAATLAVEALGERAVGLCANGVAAGRGRVRLPPGQHEGQAGHILDLLGRLHPIPDTPFPQLLETEIARLPRGTAVWIVATAADPALAPVLDRVVRRGHPVDLFWVGETAPPVPAGVRLHTVPPEVMQVAVAEGSREPALAGDRR